MQNEKAPAVKAGASSRWVLLLGPRRYPHRLLGFHPQVATLEMNTTALPRRAPWHERGNVDLSRGWRAVFRDSPVRNEGLFDTIHISLYSQRPQP
jgi:hypothetical protein